MLMRSAVVAAVLGCLTAAPAPAAEETTTDISQGGVTFKSGNNSLSIGARAQFRYTADDKEDFDADTDPNGSGFGDEDGLSQSFKVQRMRVTLKGGVYKPWLKYEFQFDMADTSGSRDNKIKDAIIEIVPREAFGLRMGQFKAPFSLQELTSSGRQQFVDRAITNPKFAPGRDQGILATGLAAGKKFGYAVGAFNGSGESNPQEDQGLLYVGRVWWDPLGEYKLFESANDLSDKHVLHVGLGARGGETIRGTATTGIFEDPDDETALNFELAYRYKRLSATGELFSMTNEVANPAGGADVDSDGFHVQVGYMFTPALEAALRYAQVDPDTDVDDNEVTETRAVLGYYWKGHNLKLQGDVGTIAFDEGFVTLCGDAGISPSPLACRNTPTVGTAIPANPGDPTQRLGGVKDYSDLQYRIQMQVAF